MPRKGVSKAGKLITVLVLLVLLGVLASSLLTQNAPKTQTQAITDLMDLGSSHVHVIVTGDTVSVTAGPDAIVSVKLFVQLDSNNAFQAFEAVYTNSEFSNITSVSIGFLDNFTDQYGNVQTELAFSLHS